MLPGDRHKSEADKILAAQKLRVSRKLRNNFTKVLSIVLAMLISLPLVQVNAISVDIAQVKSVAASGTNSDLVSVARDKENDVSDLMTITTFEALETPTREYAIKDAPKTQDALGLPEMLAATVNGKKAQVPVTWTADKSYKGALGKTIFTAIPADGYALAQGVQTPIVTVTVTRTGPGTSVTRFVVGGECGINGGNLTWSLDTNVGTLTVSGTGDMAKYNLNTSPQIKAPWTDYRTYIKRIVLAEGITSIGDYAFCASAVDLNLTGLSLPSTLKVIGRSAFQDSVRFNVAITFPEGLTRIERNAFTQSSITAVVFPQSLEYIGGNAFWNNGSLLDVTFKRVSSAPVVDTQAFYQCKGSSMTLRIPSNSPYYTSEWKNSLLALQYAKVVPFEANYIYNVTLYGNGGNPGTNLTSYTYGYGATLPTDWYREGYTFAGWYDGNGTLVSSISTTDSGDKVFWAGWNVNYYTLSTATSGGGSAGGGGSFAYGSTPSIWASPSAGWYFAGWSHNSGPGGLTNSGAASTGFSMGAGNSTVTANFARNSYRITTANGTGGASVTAGGDWSYGIAQTITATPATGYNFSHWSQSGTQGTFGNAYAASTTFTPGAGATTITANYTPITIVSRLMPMAAQAVHLPAIHMEWELHCPLTPRLDIYSEVGMPHQHLAAVQ